MLHLLSLALPGTISIQTSSRSLYSFDHSVNDVQQAVKGVLSDSGILDARVRNDFAREERTFMLLPP